MEVIAVIIMWVAVTLVCVVFVDELSPSPVEQQKREQILAGLERFIRKEFNGESDRLKHPARPTVNWELCSYLVQTSSTLPVSVLSAFTGIIFFVKRIKEVMSFTEGSFISYKTKINLFHVRLQVIWYRVLYLCMKLFLWPAVQK